LTWQAHIVVLDSSLHKALVSWVTLPEDKLAARDHAVNIVQQVWKRGSTLLFGKVKAS
jgi:hypothetical protein